MSCYIQGLIREADNRNQGNKSINERFEASRKQTKRAATY